MTQAGRTRPLPETRTRRRIPLTPGLQGAVGPSCKYLVVEAVVWQPRTSSAVDLAYVLDTGIGSAGNVVPDGRCGVALVDRVTACLAELVLTDGAVAEMAREVGLSPRQVHRRCLDEFGLPPSLLRRIAGVHRAARLTASARRAPLARLAADAGFTDQAHLCREVRVMCGQTPRDAFGWPSHVRSVQDPPGT